MEYARFADDMIITLDPHPANRKWLRAVQRRLREELSKLEVELNLEKTKVVDLRKGESCDFLGFTFLIARSKKSGKMMVKLLPQSKKRKELIQRINQKIDKIQHKRIRKIVEEINPILRGWVNYFRVGHSRDAFSYVKDWVEKKIRRTAMKQKHRQGFGWKRWKRYVIYKYWGLYNKYRITYLPHAPKS